MKLVWIFRLLIKENDMSEKLTMVFTIEIDVEYVYKNTPMTDAEIVEAVRNYWKVVEYRNDFVTEARIAAIHLLNGELLENKPKE